MTLRAVSITTTEANAYVAAFHRHNGPAQMARFAVAAVDGDGVVHGVAIAGRPIARMASRPGVLEVRRVCTDGQRNCCSFLYGCCTRAAKALGYWRLITYTVEAEDGASLKASGWKMIGTTPGVVEGGGWASRPDRRGHNAHDIGPKARWEIVLGPDPGAPVWPDVLQSQQLSLFDVDAPGALFEMEAFA